MGSTPQPSGSSGGLAPNIAALLGYLIGILAIVWLVIEPYKNDRFIRFHAFQALGFFVATIVLSIVATILSVVLMLIHPILSLVVFVIYLAIFAAWVFLMYKAYSNEMWKLPVVGNLAEKMAG